jgi:hypothetical protein
MAQAPVRGSRSALTLGLLLLLAVLVGLVAALLVAGAPTPPTPRAGEVQIDLPPTAWGALLLAPLLVGFAGILFRWAKAPAGRTGRALLLVAGVVLLCGVVMMILLNAFGSGNGAFRYTASGGSPSANTTGGGTPPNSSGPPGGTTPGTVPGTYTFDIGPWMIVALLVGVCSFVGFLAVPGVLSRLVDRRSAAPASPSVDRREVASAFGEASSALARGEDFRETIVRLYVRLLGTLAPRAGDVTALTPEEIRHRVLERLGVRHEPGRDLTRLFEVARYSSHTLGPGDAERFRSAVAAIEEDLLRGAAQ